MPTGAYSRWARSFSKLQGRQQECGENTIGAENKTTNSAYINCPHLLYHFCRNSSSQFWKISLKKKTALVISQTFLQASITGMSGLGVGVDFVSCSIIKNWLETLGSFLSEGRMMQHFHLFYFFQVIYANQE